MEQPIFKLKIITTLPYLKVTICDGYCVKVVSKTIQGALIPYYSNGSDIFSRENFLEIELPKGLYTVRLSLPYFNPTSEDNKTGIEYDMPLVMDTFFTLDRDREYRFDCKLESSVTTDYEKTIIRKQVNEKFS